MSPELDSKKTVHDLYQRYYGKRVERKTIPLEPKQMVILTNGEAQAHFPIINREKTR